MADKELTERIVDMYKNVSREYRLWDAKANGPDGDFDIQDATARAYEHIMVYMKVNFEDVLKKSEENKNY